MKTLETRNRIAELSALGFTVKIQTGPTGAVDSDNGKEWPHIAFSVQLELNGRPILSTPYKLGVGHVKPTGRLLPVGLLPASAQSSLCQSWRDNPGAQFKDKRLWADTAAALAKQQGVKPKLDDVLHSLLMDGEAFFNARSFEDWAGDFGYDPDSRKAETIFRDCDNIGRQISAAVPADILAKAREIVADL